MVQLYNLTNLDKPDKRQLLATFYGDRAYGRFGEIVRFGDVDGDGGDELMVSAPRRSRDFTEEIDGGKCSIRVVSCNLEVVVTLVVC